MIPELGSYSLVLAFCFACLLSIVPLYGVKTDNSACIASSKTLVFAQGFFIAFAYLCLTLSFLSDDFTVLYVASNSSVQLPLWYKLCAVWGAHEGSMLLWVVILSGWMVMVALFSRSLDDKMRARVLMVLGWISVGFLLFLLSTSNPFIRIFSEIPSNGRDLNPLLQDPGFLFHPPMLYMGYVGFSVAFAFAIASLLAGRLDREWARWSRPWTLAAWCCLTLGITLGSWWAYRELGWGGWWFWDPVENASFMPWLVGTALLHSLAVTQKRNSFKAWTVLLAITAFSLSLLGTFLVRSGVLTSVHAFAVDPTRGLFMLVFLLVVIGVSLTIYAWRANSIVMGEGFALLSRETFLLLNNVFLAVVMLTVLLGTLYPLFVDALGWGKLSVGAPYFNAVFVPLMMPLLLMMGLGPHCQWKSMPADLLAQRVRVSVLLALSLGLLLPWVFANQWHLGASLACVIASWIVIATVVDTLRRLSSRGAHPWTLWSLPRSHYGMVLAHVGVAACVLGIALSSSYSIERDLRVRVGDEITIADYRMKFIAVDPIKGPNYHGVQAIIQMMGGDGKGRYLYPQKKTYDVAQMTMTDSAIDAGVFRDVYLALGEAIDNNSWGLRVYYKPFIRWIWGGGLLILLGGLLALSDRQYYAKRSLESTAALEGAR